MADAAIFVGFGSIVAGRERQALAIFSEVLAYYERLQEQGELESFEAVVLEPHGGDLSGFVLLRGDEQRLHRVRTSDEFRRYTNQGVLVTSNFGVVDATIGASLQRQLASFDAAIGEVGA